MKITDTHVYFYTYRDIPSQHYPAPFDCCGLTFKTAEHWMMFCKACLMELREGFTKLKDGAEYVSSHPESIAAKVLNADHPQAAKRLGRSIQHFDHDLWEQNAVRYVYWGNVLKFQQNPECLEFMQRMGSRDYVEASDRDNIWGCGLNERDPKILDKNNWTGTNNLGKVLNKVRDKLLLEGEERYEKA